VEILTGSELFRKTGQWVNKVRRIDWGRRPRHYEETITDLETGRVIQQHREPLEDHRGHGSAKKRH